MRKIMWLALLWAVPAFAQGNEAELRKAAGCGPAKEEYHAKVAKNKHTVREPDSSKAMVYVIVEEFPSPSNFTYLGNITTRVGLDGNWVGANYGESFVSFAVEPGEHRICSDWQSQHKSQRHLSDAASLNAAAGRTYFFHAQLWTGNSGSGAESNHGPNFKLTEVDSSKGMLLVSKTGESVWKKK